VDSSSGSRQDSRVSSPDFSSLCWLIPSSLKLLMAWRGVLIGIIP